LFFSKLKINRSSDKNINNERLQPWNDYYENVDIALSNKNILLEENYIEYTKYIDSLLLNFDLNKIRIIELACGTAPIYFHIKKKYNIKIDCSDYSSAIVNRLKKEFEINAITSNIKNLNEIEDETYDLIILGGGFYENKNPLFYKEVFNSIKRILKKNGNALVVMNRHLNLLNLISFFQSIYYSYIRIKSWAYLRKIFGKKKLFKEFAIWLYDVDFIKKELENINLKKENIEYIGFNKGVKEFFKFYMNYKISNESFIFRFLKKMKLAKSFSTSCILKVKK
tara:strand:- start:272 stop:1117 length:846 start_codon:yes stop_codon:yes gene_type:complete